MVTSIKKSDIPGLGEGYNVIDWLSIHWKI